MILPQAIIIRQTNGSEKYLKSIAEITNSESRRTARYRYARAILVHEARRQSRLNRAQIEAQPLVAYGNWSQKCKSEVNSLKTTFNLPSVFNCGILYSLEAVSTLPANIS